MADKVTSGGPGTIRGRGPGRPKGSKNVLTKSFKEWLTESLMADEGPVEYFRWMKREEPRAYAGLIGKCIPRSVEGHLTGNLTILVNTGVPRDPVDGEPSPT